MIQRVQWCHCQHALVLLPLARDLVRAGPSVVTHSFLGQEPWTAEPSVRLAPHRCWSPVTHCTDNWPVGYWDVHPSEVWDTNVDGVVVDAGHCADQAQSPKYCSLHSDIKLHKQSPMWLQPLLKKQHLKLYPALSHRHTCICSYFLLTGIMRKEFVIESFYWYRW